MTQYANPTSDISKTDWSQYQGDFDGDAFDELDEGIASADGDTTSWETGSVTNTTRTIECGLGSVTDPSSASTHVIKANLRKNTTSGASVTAVLYLYQGTTLIAASSGLTLGGSAYETLSYTLSEAEANAITDYTALRLRLVATIGSGTGRRCRISTFEFSCPDASSGVSAAAAITLGDLTSTAAAVSTIDAALDKTTDGITMSAAGVSSITAALDVTLGDVTSEGAGISTIEAALDVTLGDLTTSATGTSSIVAVSAITLGDVTLTAAGEGPAATPPIIDIDHETGDLTQYTSTVNPDGDELNVTEAASLAGTSYGLAVTVDDADTIYGLKTVTENTSGVVRLRFYIDPNSISANAGNDSNIVVLYTSSGSSVAGVNLQWDGASFELRIIAVNDTPGNIYGTFYDITDEPHYVEVQLTRSSSDVASDGTMQIWIDGVDKQTLSGIDNYDRFANFGSIRFGQTYTEVTTISGTFYLDELIVRDDDTEIGPVEAAGISGAASITLDGLTTSAAGVSTIEAASQITLAGLTVSAAGTSAIEASAAITLDGLTLVATGGTGVNANAEITLDEIALTGAAVSTITAVAEITLDGITLSGAGVLPIVAQAAITLAVVTLYASTGTGVNGGALITLDDITLSGAGVAPIEGALTSQLDGVTLSALADAPAQASASITLADLTASGAAVSTIKAQATITLGDLIISAAGTSEINGALTVTLAALTLYATGSVPATGTGGRPVNYVGSRDGLSTAGPTTHYVTSRTVLSAGSRCPLYVADLEVDEL